ncbi:MAG: dipeptide epimerase [Planctomycetes bacterium]|nr:dipeptide epimerase [Planctomycetota bacterium]
MRIRQFTAHVVRLSLKRAFSHASATRRESKNVLVHCELADGTTGWGEGVPRSYVTGETPAGCVAQLASTPLAEQLSADCNSWPDVIRLCEQFAPAAERDDPRGCYGNALRCAVELSILDAFGRLFSEPLSEVSQHFSPAKPILAQRSMARYSAVIDSGAASLWRKALIRRVYGFHDCKVKVGSRGDGDVERLRTIRRWIGQRMDLRLDANEAWHADELPAKMAPLRAFKVSCIEQPVPHTEVEALSELRKQFDVPVMLDESLTSMADAEAAIAGQTCDLFNIRLSKCGGYLASLRLAAVAHAAGIGYQLGCHPGETGVLSAAGRHFACSVAGIRYLEGSYDRHVFRRPLTNEDMTFGFGGRARAITRPGLGVTMNEATLEKLIVSRQEFAIA